MTIVDIAIFGLMTSGFAIATHLETIGKRQFIAIIVAISVVIGFITSAFGMVAFLWMVIALFTGYGFGRWRHRKDSQSGEKG
ncbi:MAG: hypothetical protein R3C24_04890 [Cyanobacteriota/Melainabacteria group bacterium]|nr:hypothetical protein [Cyanobacteria bacterium HKST-UBA01]